MSFSDHAFISFHAYSSSETGATFTGALARETGDNVGTYAYTLGSLSAGTNYTLTLNNNADKFKITAKDASALNAALSVTSYVYDGAAKEPAVTVKDGGKTLVEGVDYTVAYSNNKDAGTAKAAVTYTSNYSGSKELAFTITAKDASTLTIAAVSAVVYDGKAKPPELTVMDGETKLVKGADYDVAYDNKCRQAVPRCKNPCCSCGWRSISHLPVMCIRTIPSLFLKR